MTTTTPVRIHGTCPPRFEKVREVFAQGFDSGAELGASVCFVQDGEVLIDLWGGHMDREKTRPWTRDTLVNLYRIWHRPCCIETLVESKHTLLRYDGNDHSAKTIRG